MKSITKILMAISVLLSLASCTAQIKNAKTETVKIYGNCAMCKNTIEDAGNQKSVASVAWNKDTKMATLTYDTSKTSQDEILKRIALAGYDNAVFLAPGDVYAKLPECCRYERQARKTTPAGTTPGANAGSSGNAVQAPAEPPATPQLKPVFEIYFALKDALVNTDGNTAAAKGGELLAAMKTVKMELLPPGEHAAWMNVMPGLTLDAGQIAATKNPDQQRIFFMNLSKNMHTLMSASKQEIPVYYQFCPMANDGKGANWLSREAGIKNPYYGSQMLTCGKTVETIK